MKKNLLLTIKYDGTGLFGWQRQPGKPTVQGLLEQAFSTVCKKTVRLHGCSRTDAGVHAYGQRASLFEEMGIPTDRLARVMNNRLSADQRGKRSVGPIEIIDVKEMSDGFHARFDAKGKKYIYKIRNTERPDLFQRNYCYSIGEFLDLDAMNRAGQLLEGTHDFQCFQASGGTERETTVRTIYSLGVSKRDENLTIEVVGDGFLYNMVRIITGTLVEVGQGRMQPRQIPEVIEAGDRKNAGHTAPPQGLYLAEIYYTEEELEHGRKTQLG